MDRYMLKISKNRRSVKLPTINSLKLNFFCSPYPKYNPRIPEGSIRKMALKGLNIRDRRIIEIIRDNIDILNPCL
jgi:hypothetical protein